MKCFKLPFYISLCISLATSTTLYSEEVIDNWKGPILGLLLVQAKVQPILHICL